jgi:hypothetical protein
MLITQCGPFNPPTYTQKEPIKPKAKVGQAPQRAVLQGLVRLHPYLEASHGHYIEV